MRLSLPSSLQFLRGDTPARRRQRRNLVVGLLAVGLLFATLAWRQWAPSAALQASAGLAPTPTPYVFAGTPIPYDWIDRGDQTNGIVLGGVALILIIVGGTFAVIRKTGQPRRS